uniref:DUF5018 domain-containing protein n=1 Tax=Prevotella sp. GTC17262 TaxID=3236797 RepID=A0AB33JJ36_9BACT
MRYIKFIAMMIVTLFTFTSCLESGLEELDTYEGKDITSSYVYYRYVDKASTIPASGEAVVKQLQLNAKQTIDAEKGTCEIVASLPKNFPSAEKGNISLANLMVAVQLSTAAVIEPIGDAPKLGVPADWSQSHKYTIKAADGSKKEWTLTVSLNK